MLKLAVEPRLHPGGRKDEGFLLSRTGHSLFIIALLRALASLAALLCLARASALAESALAAPGAARLRDICLNALGERTGAVVVMDARTGDVLAAVPEDWSRRPMPPGSVAKIVTAYAGLSGGRITSTTRFHCSNALTVGGKVRHCTVPGGHGSLDLDQAIAQSCNVWFYQAARRIGTERILKAWREFGVTGVGKRVDSPERLAVGEQGVRVSCLEMATLVRRVVTQRKRDRSMELVARGMRGAVTSGTAKELAGLGLSVAGKTGSPSQASDADRRHGWFAGFAPYDNPEICIAVFCLEGNSYRSAVPVAAEVLKGYFGARAR